jgi:glutamate synthase (NADPH/NADH) small chain
MNELLPDSSRPGQPHLDDAGLQERFSEVKPAMTLREARIEADRCLYCFDAPCVHACPTSIDIPLFIHKISTGNLTGSATTILEANLLGASCARVCPVEELCEGACVLGEHHKPIEIGRLQRHATDHLYGRGIVPFEPLPPTGMRVAVVGSGPAGLSCAGELAKLGHDVTVFEKQPLPGGLSTYGIVVLREPIRVALEEVELIRSLGVTIINDVEVGTDVRAADLLDGYDAVFLGVGLGEVPELQVPGEDLAGVDDALPFIAATKLAEKDGLANLRNIPVGRHVAVIGAGNTAIDAATVAKRLGAERVTLVYRRTDTEMTAYDAEYAFARNEGVEFRFLTQPVEIIGREGRVNGLKCVRMQLTEPGADGRRGVAPVIGSEFILECDQVIKAIGQTKLESLFGQFEVELERGYARVDDALRTSNPRVFAGGDAVRITGEAMTVTAVEDGKIAARSIHELLSAQRVQGLADEDERAGING